MGRNTLTKICKTCKQEKELTEFYRNKGNKLDRDARCKLCRNAAARARHKANPKRQKAAHIKWKYGITLDQYNILLESQNNVCAICKQICASGNDLGVDHDHITGNVRGLLCVLCNNGLGQFRDNPDWLNTAAEYVTRRK